MERQFDVGDRVRVNDVSMALLKRLCPDIHLNHHGTVAEHLEPGCVLIHFDDGTVAPFPYSEIEHLPGK